MTKPVVGKDAGHHGFGHGSAAKTDAWVMAALGLDVGFIAMGIYGLDRSQYGTGWLESHAADNVLPR